MPIQVACPSCSSRFNAPDAAAGKRLKCKCGATIAIPGIAGAPVANTAATAVTVSSPTQAASSNEKIQVVCSQCGRKAAVPISMGGKKAKCGCGALIDIPAGSQGRSSANTNSPVAPALSNPTPNFSSGLLDQLAETDLSKSLANPYAPPPKTSLSDATVLKNYFKGDEKAAEAKKTSEGNLTFLAIIHFIGGSGYFILAALLFALSSLLAALASVLPFAAGGLAILAIIIIVLGSFDIAIGIGLIQRKAWGWWLCVIGLSWGVIDRFIGVVSGFIKAEDWTAMIPPAIGALVFMMASFYFINFMILPDTQSKFRLKVKPGVAWGVALGIGFLVGGIISGGAVLYASNVEGSMQAQQPVESTPGP